MNNNQKERKLRDLHERITEARSRWSSEHGLLADIHEVIGEMLSKPSKPSPAIPAQEVDLERLRELEAKAKPGPWELRPVRERGKDGDNENWNLIHGAESWDGKGYDTFEKPVFLAYPDAALLVALRNTFPAILSHLTTLTQDKAALELELKDQKHYTQQFIAQVRKEQRRTEQAQAALLQREAEVARLRGLVEKLFASCTPHPVEHPTMYVAWVEAGDYLTERAKR